MLGDTPLNQAWHAQCSMAYSARENFSRSSSVIFLSMYSRRPRQACAMVIWANVMETWKQDIVSSDSASHSNVKYSFTEKCANWTTDNPYTPMTVSRLEHVDSTACAGFSLHQSSQNVGVKSISKSNARNSVSSLTRSGWEAAATHWKSWCAHSQFCLPISSNVQSYVS